MKKNYLKPQIEYTTITGTWGICIVSIDQGGTQPPGQGGPSGPPSGAPIHRF